MRSAVLELHRQRRRRGRRRWIVVVALLAAVVWGVNVVLVGRPVAAAFAADPRAAGVDLAVHLRNYVDPTTLVLDLRRVQVADSTDLFHCLLLAAKAIGEVPWNFSRILLDRAGESVYSVAGADLQQVARDYGVSRKPAAVLATLVQKLRLPGGQELPAAAVAEAARRWARGHS